MRHSDWFNGKRIEYLEAVLARLRKALERLLDAASEVAMANDDEDLTEACRIARNALKETT